MTRTAASAANRNLGTLVTLILGPPLGLLVDRVVDLSFATTACLEPLKICPPLARGNEPLAACPSILGTQHGDRNLGGIGVGGNAVLVQVFGRLLDFHVAGERGHDRL